VARTITEEKPCIASFASSSLEGYIPKKLRDLSNLQTEIPRVAKDKKLMRELETAVQSIPTKHQLWNGDARAMQHIEAESVHLVLTSPPYWTLKEYRERDGQMGHIADYELFLAELDKVWTQCFDALAPGGRLICVVGDVCLSRRKNNGRHTVVPLHASIQEHCRTIGYDNLSPIIWHKISNAVYEVDRGGGFLGKPYEPNGVIKNDIEFILMQRKPGGYRAPNAVTKLLSIISEENHRIWFQQIWLGLTGASTKNHPAPYPVELAERLIRMFSFVGDTVLDPFLGSGTTTIAAARWGRNSIGYEIDEHYFDLATQRITSHTGTFAETSIRVGTEKSELVRKRRR
jgi:DNA modification methylase